MREKKFLEQDFLEKKKSPIHGQGIFSRIKIPSNKVFYVVPLAITFSSPFPRFAKIKTNMYVNDEKVLNWVNHSCSPNSELVVEQNRVVLRAKADIKAEEEITLDYCETEDKNNLIECNCGSKKCRNYFYIS